MLSIVPRAPVPLCFEIGAQLYLECTSLARLAAASPIDPPVSASDTRIISTHRHAGTFPWVNVLEVNSEIEGTRDRDGKQGKQQEK